MTMYCPKCLNDTLYIKDSGVVEIQINEKKMDSGRFLYNLQNKEQIYSDASSKLDEFIKWLSNFTNLKPVKEVQLLTADIKCEQGCSTGMTKISAIDKVIPAKVVRKELAVLSEKYNMDLELIP